MPTFYVDETGFTGEDLMAEDQPVFAQASVDLDVDEARRLIGDLFKEVKATELKHSGMARKSAGQDRIVEMVKVLSADPNRAATWVAHKEYAALTFVVEWWIEPLAYRSGINLYQDGGNQALANMLFICLQGFWDRRFRRKVLLAFQKMFRARTKERYDECSKLVRDTYDESFLDQRKSSVLHYLAEPFDGLGFAHVEDLPPRVFDLALPGLARLGHCWRSRHEGPWEVVHDRSSNMAKQKWLWDALSATDLGPAQFDGPHGGATYPMNVVQTRFADSDAEPQIQICDLLAGATSAALRLEQGDRYRDHLWEAGIVDLIADSVWPSDAVTPDALGRAGWDGNKALEWMTAELARKRPLG